MKNEFLDFRVSEDPKNTNSKKLVVLCIRITTSLVPKSFNSFEEKHSELQNIFVCKLLRL